MNALLETIGVVLDELVAVGTGSPLGISAAKHALGRWFASRERDAREILIEELASGKKAAFEVAADDEAIAVIVRYLKSATEGNARLNLRLLAKAIAGQLRRGRLYADEFLRFAGMLESLTRDEIILLATLYHFAQAVRQLKDSHPGITPPPPWGAARSELAKSLFPSPEYVDAIGARAQRSGLIFAKSAYGGLTYELTPLFDELSRTVDFQDALRQEGCDIGGSSSGVRGHGTPKS